MEWAFAGADKVRQDINDIILKALSSLRPAQAYQDVRDGERIPVASSPPGSAPEVEGLAAHQFTTMKFADSIAMYGIDKPDLRIPGRVSKGTFSAENDVLTYS